MHKNETDLLSYNIYEISSKQIIYLNVRSNSIKFLEGNISVNLCALGSDNCFLGMTPKAKATKENIDKLEFIKMKNFYASKDTLKTVKIQCTQ